MDKKIHIWFPGRRKNAECGAPMEPDELGGYIFYDWWEWDTGNLPDAHRKNICPECVQKALVVL
jgi:hypothetical protein